MSKSVSTTKIAGNIDYAKVPDRLKAFREENPRAQIVTHYEMNEHGLVFVATITIDRKSKSSAKATGHAYYSTAEAKKPKAFEKLETISVGRALANLGYLNDGQIATTEEMEEFEDYKEQRQAAKKSLALDKISKAKSLDELREAWVDVGDAKSITEVVEAKDTRKEQLENENS